MDQLPYPPSVLAVTGGTIVGTTLSGCTILASTLSGNTILNSTSSGGTHVGGTFSGNTFLAATISGVAIVGTSTFSGTTVGLSDVFTSTNAANTSSLCQVISTSTGSSALAALEIQNNSLSATRVRVSAYGTGLSGSLFGIAQAGYTSLVTLGASSNGLMIGCQSLDKPIIFGAGTNELGRFSSSALTTGVFSILYSLDATSATVAGTTLASGLGIAKTLIAGKGQGWGVTSTATAAATTTLVQASTIIQSFTGSTTQTVQFPAANLWGAGIAVMYVINNQSSGTVTPTRAGSDTFQGGGTTDPVTAGKTVIYASNGVSVWLKIAQF